MNKLPHIEHVLVVNHDQPKHYRILFHGEEVGTAFYAPMGGFLFSWSGNNEGKLFKDMRAIKHFVDMHKTPIEEKLRKFNVDPSQYGCS